MKKSLLLCALLSVILFAGCTTTNSKCPKWSEYIETFYDNWNIESQWCLTEDDTMEWHWVYYFENGWKDIEWDMSNDLPQWERIIYDEDGQNIVRSRWTYENGLEEGERIYYDNDWTYMCSDVYSKWKLTSRWTCDYDE